MSNQPLVFENFTNKYALSKTLRFELKPLGKTLENMHEHLKYDEKLQTFLKDQEIEDAYQTLKPIFDYLHEQFITESLESEISKTINFSQYLEKYRDKKELKDKDFEPIEKNLRASFSKTYDEVSEKWKLDAGLNSKGKAIFKEKGYKILTESSVLSYIEKNISTFSQFREEKDIKKALDSFRGFFTYFSGFNQNRENYYNTGKKAATAVATRIVHENLPKFCDNVVTFEARAEEYIGAFVALEKIGRHLVNKKGEQLYPISSEIFDINHFNKCFSQKEIEEYNENIGNANFIINLYNQAQGKENFKKLLLFKTLYKQIGCGKRNTLFFTITHDTRMEAEKARGDKKDAFSLEEILLLAKKAGETYFVGISEDGKINTIPEFLHHIKTRENYEGVYWSKIALNSISNKYFANWQELSEKMVEAKIFGKGDKDSDGQPKIPEVVELESLFEVLNRTEDWKKLFFKKSVVDDEYKMSIIQESLTPSEALLNLICYDIEELSKYFNDNSEEIIGIKKYNDKDVKEKIKKWLDSALKINQILKNFIVKESRAKGAPVDAVITESINIILGGDINVSGIYGDFEEKFEHVDWFKWYDATRNYLTKKPQDDIKSNKLKLNFENCSLAAGWDINKESDNYCVFLQDDEKKGYLAIIAKQDNEKGYKKVFEKKKGNPLYEINGLEVWKKMEYKLLPGPNKMLPKCLIPKSNRKKYGATDDILLIYDSGSFKKSEQNFSKNDLIKLINFYKQALEKYEEWKCFNFSFRAAENYEDISQFYSEVEKQGYRLDFIDINKSELDRLVHAGKIYLFAVKNQDFNRGKRENHKDNLHTIYWKCVFESVANRPKLNGEAEVFYRKALSTEKLEKINDKSGKEIIKNYRFSKEKFLFHVPITLNFCLKNEKINSVVNEYFPKDPNTHFLGIDRGEKHLAFYSLIDAKGNIVYQGSFNKIDGHNYHEKLGILEKNRMEARKNWQTINTIKELKNGYISQVVRKIVDLAIKHQAYIVLENLNIGFKRGRQKIEKSVYQNLELALAKKLNFLVDKDINVGESGSVTRAFQLTPPVSNFGDIEGRNQFGIMLYIKADYTSQTDPITGWRKSRYLKRGSEERIKKQILSVFTDIGFDGSDYFFTYVDEVTGKEWKLYSGKNGKSLDRFNGERGREKGEWISTPQNIVKNLNELFENFDKQKSLYEQLKNDSVKLLKISEKFTAWDSLRFTIDTIQNIRNTGVSDEDNDFLLSPVRDSENNHFDSRKARGSQPGSGDANGAYNIARKGIVMNEHIKRGYKLYISDFEWDAWLAGRDIWEKWVKDNEKKLKQDKKKE